MDIINIIKELTLNHWIIVIIGTGVGILIGWIWHGSKNINKLSAEVEKSNAEVIQDQKDLLNSYIKFEKMAAQAEKELTDLTAQIDFLKNDDFTKAIEEVDALIEDLELTKEKADELLSLVKLNKDKNRSEAKDMGKEIDKELTESRIKAKKVVSKYDPKTD